MQDTKFASALGRIPSGLFVITVRKGEEGAALLGSWVQQASFEPPTVTLAIHKDRPVDKFLSDHSTFAINILTKENKPLYSKFVKGVPPGTNAFEGVSMKDGSTGVPYLSEALGVLECRVRQRVDVGDHHLIIADVLDGQMLTEGEPWVHVRKNGLSY